MLCESGLSLSCLSASCDDVRWWNTNRRRWNEGDDRDAARGYGDLRVVGQKDNYLLLDQGWLWVTKISESKTTDNRGLLQFHSFQLRDPWATRSHTRPPSKMYHTETHCIFSALRRDNVVRQIGDGFSNQSFNTSWSAARSSVKTSLFLAFFLWSFFSVM